VAGDYNPQEVTRLKEKKNKDYLAHFKLHVMLSLHEQTVVHMCIVVLHGAFSMAGWNVYRVGQLK